MDDILFTDTGTPIRVKITKQWLVAAYVKVRAYPKAGPEVYQALCIPFLTEQKPSHASVENRVKIILGDDDAVIESYNSYQTSHAELVPVKPEKEEDELPGETEPEER